MAGLAGATIVESVPTGTGLMASCFIAPGRGGVGLAGLTFVGIVFGGVILGLTTFWKSGLVCCAVVRGGSIFGTGLCSSLEGGWCGRGVCLSSDFSRDGFDSTIEWPVFRFVEWPAPAPDPGPLDGASVAIESMARIIAPAIVQDRTCRIPAIVISMLARLPNSIIGLEAKGQRPSLICRECSRVQAQNVTVTKPGQVKKYCSASDNQSRLTIDLLVMATSSI